jgi:hypothetical protein
MPGDGKLRLSLTTTLPVALLVCACARARKFFAVFHIIGRLDGVNCTACRLKKRREGQVPREASSAYAYVLVFGEGKS